MCADKLKMYTVRLKATTQTTKQPAFSKTEVNISQRGKMTS